MSLLSPITRTPALVSREQRQNLMQITSASWWSSFGQSFWGPILESDTGAWQNNVTLDNRNIMISFAAVYACITGIAGDIAKCGILLDQWKSDGRIWEQVTEADAHGNANAARWLALLEKPNNYQTQSQFIENWLISKLIFGNAYILLQRDGDFVTAMHVLDPNRVTALITTLGDVYYQLRSDYLAGVIEQASPDNTVPARFIIHDRMNCLWHPLVGVSPLYACGTSATMGNKIQANSTNFFANASRPSGVLSAPGHINDDTAVRIKAATETAISGQNIGRLLVLGDGLDFKPMFVTAENSQLLEQLQFVREDVGIAFHYPISKLGGPAPQYSKPEDVQLGYYTDCLQPHVEAMEHLLNKGLSLPYDYCTEVDIDNLLRMDTMSLFESNQKGRGWMKPNEMRRRRNLPPIDGGDQVYGQDQDHSLEWIAKRDAIVPPAPKPAPPQLPMSEPQKQLTRDEKRILQVSKLRNKILLPA